MEWSWCFTLCKLKIRPLIRKMGQMWSSDCFFLIIFLNSKMNPTFKKIELKFNCILHKSDNPILGKNRSFICISVFSTLKVATLQRECYHSVSWSFYLFEVVLDPRTTLYSYLQNALHRISKPSNLLFLLIFITRMIKIFLKHMFHWLIF